MDISVIVPVYHGKQYIGEMIKQIESNAGELGENASVELVLVNDAPDDSIDVALKSEIVEIVVLNTERNRGIQGARVRGLDVCRGEYVLFLDQDDLIKPSYLKSQLSAIGDCDACVCRAIHEGKQYYDEVRIFEREVTKAGMLERGCGIVSPGQVLMKKKAVSRIWKQNLLEHNGADDWLLWLCMFGEGKRFALNQEILFEHVVDGTNTSCNMEKMMHSENDVYRVLSETGLLSDSELDILHETIGKVQSKRFSIMDRFKKQFFVYDTWMHLESRGLTISDYLAGQGYHKVAIYGYGFLGVQLLGRLQNGTMKVSYILDRNAKYLDCIVPIYTMEDSLPKADVVIVTLIDGEKDVTEKLKEKLGIDVVTLRGILGGMQGR